MLTSILKCKGKVAIQRTTGKCCSANRFGLRHMPEYRHVNTCRTVGQNILPQERPKTKEPRAEKKWKPGFF